MVRLDAAESTNDVALGLAAEGAAEGTVVVANEQRRGRGRQGRVWHAAPGANLSCSVVLRPIRERREWPDLSWALAGAVAAMAQEAGVAAPRIKYPNDVIAEGGKIAGLLLETRSGAGGPTALVAGIGVNVNVRPEDFPEELRGRAASLLSETGRPQPMDEVLARLCRHLDRWYACWLEEGAEGVRRLIAQAGIGFWGDDGDPRGALESPAETGKGG